MTLANNFDEITRILADPTRLKIYRHIIGAGNQSVTVADMADSFGLHPNVARMHLEKLTRCGLLKSEVFRNGTGGRPGRHYTVGATVATQFPPRDYQLMATIALKALDSGRKPDAIARKMGKLEGQKSLIAAGLTDVSPTTARLENLKRIVDEQGLFAQVTDEDDNRLKVEIFNCIFRELSGSMPMVCELHKSFLNGVCESHLGKVRLSGKSGLAEGGKCCQFLLGYQE